MIGRETHRDLQAPPPFMVGQGRRGGLHWVRPAQILNWIAADFGIPVVDLIGQSRKAPLVEARALAVWAMRGLCGLPSYPQIGRTLGGRDHSSAIDLHEKAIALRLRSPRFAGACVDITRHFQSGRKLNVR